MARRLKRRLRRRARRVQGIELPAPLQAHRPRRLHRAKAAERDGLSADPEAAAAEVFPVRPDRRRGLADLPAAGTPEAWRTAAGAMDRRDKEAGGQEGYSSPHWSREDALRFAKQQIEFGSNALRIQGPSGTISAEEIAARCASGGRE